jgi:hypothetical protein
MFQFEVNDAVIVEQQKALEAALSTNPKTEAVLRKIIRKYVLEARQQVMQSIRFKNGDPRGAARAVRTAVYKKVLGANINIFNSRKAHGQNSYEPPRKLRPGQRGGNRVKRGPLTNRMMHYAPQDRGMILRWVNSGTDDRTAGTRGGKLSGNRGSIAPRNFFRPLGDRALGTMRDNLATAIEEEMVKLLPHDK